MADLTPALVGVAVTGVLPLASASLSSAETGVFSPSLAWLEAPAATGEIEESSL